MKLFKNDNKLLILHSPTAHIYNITDSLPNHTIKKVILNSHRVVILTTTNLYYLFHPQDNFQLVDLTDGINRITKVDSINYITNVFDNDNSIGILTNNAPYRCKVNEDGTHYRTDVAFYYINSNIIAVSSEYFGYVYINDKQEYVMKQYTRRALEKPHDHCTVCEFKEIYCHHKFPSLCIKMQYDTLSLDDNYKVTLNKKINGTQNVTISHDTEIIQSHYYIKRLWQYSNTTLDIPWTTTSHKLFDKYTKKYIKIILLCYKCSGTKIMIPIVLFYQILQLVL